MYICLATFQPQDVLYYIVKRIWRSKFTRAP